MDKKRSLIVIRQTPYGHSRARAGLDTALAHAAFDQPVSLLYLGDGVLQLVPEQDSAVIGVKNIAKLISSFELYDIDTLYVDEQAVSRLGLAKTLLPEATQYLNDNAIRALITQHDHLLSF